MTLRCLSRTSSYLRTSLRISAFLPSTVFCARSIALVTIFASIGTSSGSVRLMTHCIAPVANSRISSSSSDKKKRLSPRSPCLPERPRSWLSMRRLSWRSLPST